MSKIVEFVNLLISLSVLLLISTNYVYAQQANCSVKTEPSPLYSTTPSGKFIVNVGNNNNYEKYKMEFECGIKPNIDFAGKEAGSTTNIIRYLINNSSFGIQPCEFEGGTSHTIKVFAVTPTGQEVEQCSVSYTVLDADTQCRLTVNPTTGIGSATQLTVSGENLTPGQRFVFFFDNNAVNMADDAIVPQVVPNNLVGADFIRDQKNGNVNTSTFGPKSIPQELMTPGNHTVSLRRRNKTVNFNLISSEITNSTTPIKAFFDPPFCPVSCSVTADSKGECFAPGTVSTTTPCTDPKTCSSAGGIPCTDDPKNPGIVTAIGCIHTNPVVLVKDISTFVVGIGGGLAFLMMLLGAFQMLTSAGNPETLAAGKDRLTSAIIGLLFVIFAVLLMQIIGLDILGLPGFIR